MSRVPPAVARGLASILLLGGLGAWPAHAATDVGSVTFTLGSKRLSRDWAVGSPRLGATGDTLPAQRPEQPALGFELTWGRAGWPVLVAFDVLHSYDDGVQHYPAFDLGSLVIPPANVRRRARTFEIGLGARRSGSFKGFSPYVGAGAAWVWATVDYEMSDPSQGQFGAPGPTRGGQDSGPGFWAGGGVFRPIGPRFQIGLAGRYSRAKLTVPASTVYGQQGGYYFAGGDTEVEAGGRHVGLVVGWVFPGRK